MHQRTSRSVTRWRRSVGLVGRAAGAAVAVIAMSTIAMSSGEPSGAATADPPPEAIAAARAAAVWLAARVGPDGAVASAAGTPGYGDTREVALALAAVGGEPDALARAVGWLAANLDAPALGATDLRDATGRDQPGRLAQLILTAVATGRSPSAFGGSANVNDLVARLIATRRDAGADIGLFGAQPALFDGAFRQGLSLAALRAAGRVDEAAADWLARQQCSDGSWMGLRPDLAQPCAFDPETFVGPDTNSTAMAAIGLAAACRTPAVDVVAYARTSQGDDGGWSYSGSPTDSADPNSTAGMISALAALGADPSGDGAADPYAALRAFQFPDGPDAGAFWFPPFGDAPRTANLMATTQAAIALAGRTLPFALVEGAGPCPTTASTTTTTTTTSTLAPSSTSTSTSTSTTTTTTTTTARPSTSVAPATTVASATAVAGSGVSRDAPAATAVRSNVAYTG